MNWVRSGGLALWCGFVCCQQTVTAQQDQVMLLRGSPITGIIQEAETSPVEVVVEAAGGKRRVPVNEIRRVSFTQEPKELSRARDSIIDGQVEAGYDQLKTIDQAGIQRAAVKEDLLFWIGYCQAKLALTGGGDKNLAVRTLYGFHTTFPRSFHRLQVAELLGDLAIAMGRYDNASQFYSELAKVPWPEYQLKAPLLEARALIAQDKYAEAQAKYEQILASPLDTPEATRQKLLAQAGKAACLGQTGAAEEGLKLMEELITKNSPEDTLLFGKAYNAQGVCYLKANKSKEALHAFLHTDLLFNSDAESHAEALYYLSKLWQTVSKADRAVAARNLLTERYAGSAWAKRE